MNRHKNIVQIVFNYFNRRFSERECMIMFGVDFGTQLWDRYVRFYDKNPYLFFMEELTDEWQDALTIRAQQLSLNNDEKDEMDSLAAIAVWPIDEMWRRLIDEIPLGVEFPVHGVQNDFPMKNGWYTANVMSAMYDGNSLVLRSEYNGEPIMDYIEKMTNPRKILAIHKSFKK